MNLARGDVMPSKNRAEDLLLAWVKLTAIVKNSRITKGLAYNEAIIMLCLYRRFKQDGEGLVSASELIKNTGMLKSLLNRTINSLEEKGLLEKVRGISDRRTLYVKCVKDRLDLFIKVHGKSLEVAEKIMNIIGEEDTARFIGIVQKIEASGYSPESGQGEK